MIEVWKQSKQAPDYLISNTGRVVRDSPGQGARPYKQIKQYVPADGRPTVTLRVAGKTKTFRVCNLVVEAYHGPQPQPRYECCHNDGNPGNNRADNLRWDSRSGNRFDMAKHGTAIAGERHHNAKLTQKAVEEILRLWAETNLKQREIAQQFGIGQVQVSRIINGKRWLSIS